MFMIRALPVCLREGEYDLTGFRKMGAQLEPRGLQAGFSLRGWPGLPVTGHRWRCVVAEDALEGGDVEALLGDDQPVTVRVVVEGHHPGIVAQIGKAVEP